MSKRFQVLTGALLIGAANAIIYAIFEYLVHHGTNYIWNDLFNTDTIRWRVVPLAAILSLLLGAIIIALSQTRLTKPHINAVEHEDRSDSQPVHLSGLATIFVIGVASLLAGASLGPEASLAAISSGLGLWIAERLSVKQTAKLLILSSVGALLVAFFGSLFPVLIPILMLYKKRVLSVTTALPPILAGLTSYLTLYLINGAHGFGTIPVEGPLKLTDVFTAFLLGALCLPLAKLLFRLIGKLHVTAKRASKSIPWFASAIFIGLVLGLIYWLGGPTIQFSGSEGSEELIKSHASYSNLALVGLILTKLLATGWSLAAGYRGGLVFPSVYAGLALGILIGNIFGNASDIGLIIGAVTGIFGAILGGAVGLVLVVAMLPLNLASLAVSATAGVWLAQKILNQTLGKSHG